MERMTRSIAALASTLGVGRCGGDAGKQLDPSSFNPSLNPKLQFRPKNRKVHVHMRMILLPITIFLITGCAGMAPIAESSYQREFVYNYNIPGKTKANLFKAARENLALSYGDANKVLRIVDESEGTIVGKGIVSWRILPGAESTCDYDYNIKFISKDERARLILNIAGISRTSRCGWDVPSVYGYDQIKKDFDAINASLDEALKLTTNAAKDSW